MKRAITILVLAFVALLVNGSVPPAKACMQCDPAYILVNQYGTECIITTIDYDCQVCTVVPDPCPPGGGHVWHRY
jgi:hypothetical protein